MKTTKAKHTLKFKQKFIGLRIKSKTIPGKGITPLVRELSGIAPIKKDLDEKKIYSGYLESKYSK